MSSEVGEAETKTSSGKKVVLLSVALLSLVIFAAVATLFFAQRHNEEMILNLHAEVNLLKAQMFLLQEADKVVSRTRRRSELVSEAEDGDVTTAKKSGVHIYDYAYGVDMSKKSSLYVYPSLMGEDGQGGNTDQLGIHRQTSNPASAASTASRDSSQSAYAKRVNAFRRSRVSSTATEDPPPPPPSPPATPPPPPPIPQAIKRPMLKSLDFSRMFDSEAAPLLSIHLQAKVSLDESSANLTNGIHNSWRPSPWSKQLHGATLFQHDLETGVIEIPEDGLYLVYAQVEYLDVHDINGFELNVDEEATLSCVVNTHHGDKQDQKKKHNTCHTSGVIYLQRGSTLQLKDKEAGRYSLLHSKGTFFGATKISTA